MSYTAIKKNKIQLTKLMATLTWTLAFLTTFAATGPSCKKKEQGTPALVEEPAPPQADGGGNSGASSNSKPNSNSTSAAANDTAAPTPVPSPTATVCSSPSAIIDNNVAGISNASLQMFARGLAQSFTVDQTTQLSSIELNIKGASTLWIAKVDIYSGGSLDGELNNSVIVRNGTLIAQDDAPLSTSYTFVEFTFDTQPILRPGITYWIVLYTETEANEWLYWRGSGYNSFSGGATWRHNYVADYPWVEKTDEDQSFRLNGCAR